MNTPGSGWVPKEETSRDRHNISTGRLRTNIRNMLKKIFGNIFFIEYTAYYSEKKHCVMEQTRI